MKREHPILFEGIVLTECPVFEVRVIEHFPPTNIRPRTFFKDVHPIPKLHSSEDDQSML